MKDGRCWNCHHWRPIDNEGWVSLGRYPSWRRCCRQVSDATCATAVVLVNDPLDPIPGTVALITGPEFGCIHHLLAKIQVEKYRVWLKGMGCPFLVGVDRDTAVDVVERLRNRGCAATMEKEEPC